MLRRPLPADAEVAINGRVEPFLINGGNTVKTLSAAFLADLQEDWLQFGKKIFPVLREKHPQAYFNGLVALSKVIRWEDVTDDAADRGLTPEEIMDKLEERVGPEGRKLFEQFLEVMFSDCDTVDDDETGTAAADPLLDEPGRQAELFNGEAHETGVRTKRMEQRQHAIAVALEQSH